VIPIPPAVRVWIATGHTDMRRGMNSLAVLVQEALGATRTAATSTCSVARAANTRHSAYSLRSATIAYPWHPLFGRTLQVAPFRRGKDLKCIYTEERRGFSREAPNWMFDEGYCAGMALGPPQVSIDGLNELAVVLKLLGTNQVPGARSRPSRKREKGRAEKKPISRGVSTESGSGRWIPQNPLAPIPKG
jgi:hypothetical protein